MLQITRGWVTCGGLMCEGFECMRGVTRCPTPVQQVWRCAWKGWAAERRPSGAHTRRAAPSP